MCAALNTISSIIFGIINILYEFIIFRESVLFFSFYSYW